MTTKLDIENTACDAGREACLGRQVHVLFHLLMRQCDAAAEEIGLTSSRWFLLCSIGNSAQEPTIGQLSEEMMLSTQAVSRLVAVMEKEGLVARSTKPGSGRSVYVRILEAGKVALEKTGEVATQIEGRLLAGMSQDKVEQIRRDLERLIENISSKKSETAR